jgi:hypothetical protein
MRRALARILVMAAVITMQLQTVVAARALRRRLVKTRLLM